jgi:hypothetical protein
VRHGFSLAEVLIASVVLVTCMLPVITLSQRTLAEASCAQEDLLARHILIDMAERFRTSPLAELKGFAGDPARLANELLLTPLAWRQGRAENERRLAGDVLRLTRTIAVAENFKGQAGLHKVTFAVDWQSRQKRSRRVTLVRLVHEH